MSIFNKIKSFLFGLKGTRDHKTDSVMTQFDLIDPKKIKNLHNIHQAAKDNGEQEIPSSKEKIPDSIEEKVLSTIKTIEADEGNKFTSRNEAYRRSMTALASDLDMEKLEQLRTSKTAKAENIVLIGINDLYTLKKKFLAADKNLKIFKIQNGLEDTALRNQRNQLLSIGILTFIFMIETFMNAAFFTVSAESAYLSSIMIAFALSFLNIVFPFTYGYKILPWVNSVKKTQKILGQISVLIALIIIFSINSLATNLREVMDNPEIINFGDAAIIAISNFTFQFKSAFSYFFMTIGLFLALYAINKGYDFDDPYPGYGKITRTTEDLEEQIQDRYAELIDNLDEAIGEFDQNFHFTLDSIATRREKFTNINSLIISLHQKFIASQSQFSTVYISVITDYREINKKHRKTPPPTFFNNLIKYEHSFKIIKQVDLKFTQSVEQTLKEAKIKLPQLIKKVDRDRGRLRKMIPSLDELTKITG